jgi:WD40 repeat protein
MCRKIQHPHQHGCRLTLAPDGRTLATSDIRYAGDLGENTIRLYDIETGEQILTLEPGDGWTSVMTFSPDGKRLFTGFGRGSGIVWDVRRVDGTSNAQK